MHQEQGIYFNNKEIERIKNKLSNCKYLALSLETDKKLFYRDETGSTITLRLHSEESGISVLVFEKNIRSLVTDELFYEE